VLALLLRRTNIGEWMRPVTIIATLYSFVVTTLGGVFVGFSLCGGYGWHSTVLAAHTGVCALVLAGVLLLEGRKVASFAAVAALWGTWYLTQVVGQTFYWNELGWSLSC